ncbi:hypothetical protein [Pseudorhodoferax sp.]|uniref:hypothetical protein n=1 Tax=Pseudorhodoferax sp. TaxID=1993553 RepID=UPI0039E47822
MSSSVPTPFALYQANLDLLMRLEQLRQQASRQWLDFGSAALQQDAAQAFGEAGEMGRTANWQTLAALPAEAFWRQLQLQFGRSQAMAEQAAHTQAEYAAGLVDAVQQWQAQATQALGGDAAQGSSPATHAMQDFLRPWQAWMPPRAGQ